MIRSLSRPYVCRGGAPVVDRVDTAIFVRTYFMDCMGCSYCHDSCCQYGADVEGDVTPRIQAHAEGIEAFTGVPRERWFRGGREVEWTPDKEFPGGRQTRTSVEGGACVFRSRSARGCMLHTFALGQGLDYHEVKPMVCSLFPVTFDYGLLHPSNEIEDRSLQCIDDGPSLYKGVRDEIAYYFGAELVAELDALERGDLREPEA
ncbi:MAG TPA: hypothetical protein VHV30_11710 [Polyangiaceae bacterium]|nr:hypothetical protein [Polyangiaceae bacterium]